MSLRKRKEYCSIRSCINNAGTFDLDQYMFRAPKDEERRLIWMNAIQNHQPDIGSSVFLNICIKHFAPADVEKKTNKFKLKANAIPMIFEPKDSILIPHGYGINVNPDDEGGCDDVICENCVELKARICALEKELLQIKLSHDIEEQKMKIKMDKLEGDLKAKYDRIKCLKKEILVEKKESHRLKTEVDRLTKNNDDDEVSTAPKLNTMEIINCLQHGNPILERYPESVRLFSLSLHCYSPRAYEYVREVFNKHMPHVSTLRAWYRNSDLDGSPGIGKRALAILRQKAEEMKKNGNQLLVSLIFDEMAIRRNVQWCNKTNTFLGHITYGEFEDSNESPLANNVIVFMVNGVNTYIREPIAYYFITSLKYYERKDLLMKILCELASCDIRVSNVTFDGYLANTKMCGELGAVFESEMKTHFKNPYDGHDVFIIYDPSHMMKLVRNTFGSYEILYDDEGNKIEWKYIENMVDVSKDSNFGLTHKLNKRHLQWRDRKMHVRTAVETLSKSCADSIDFLIRQDHPLFKDADPTVKFIKIFDRLFDILNTKKIMNHHNNKFKSAWNAANKDEVLAFLNEAVHYILALKVRKENSSELVSILKSKVKTGFRGFIVDIHSCIKMYYQYVEETPFMPFFATYRISQDHLEIFFSKIRLLHGCNDNPTVQQFISSYRKLQLNYDLLISGKSNVTDGSTTSDVLRISSTPLHLTSCATNMDLDLVEETADLRQLDEGNYLTENTSDAGISYVASVIENRLLLCEQTYCEFCIRALRENEKVDPLMCVSLSNGARPCRSTYQLCKLADTAMKFHQQEQKFYKEKVTAFVLRKIELNTLYPHFFEPEHDSDDRHFLIKFVIHEYIHIKATYTCKNKTLDLQKNYIRNKLRKNIHNYGY